MTLYNESDWKCCSGYPKFQFTYARNWIFGYAEQHFQSDPSVIKIALKEKDQFSPNNFRVKKYHEPISFRVLPRSNLLYSHFYSLQLLWELVSTNNVARWDTSNPLANWLWLALCALFILVPLLALCCRKLMNFWTPKKL